MSQIDARQLAKMWIRETPSGSVNGSNVTFTITQTPVENDSIDLYLDGIYQIYTTDYTISGTTITMTAAPALGQSIYVRYIQLRGGT